MSNEAIKAFNVEKLKQRDEAALKEFFDQVIQELHRYGASRKIPPLELEDIVNETVLRVFKNIDSIATKENPYPYCVNVMRNVIRETRKRAQMVKESESIETLIQQEDTDEVAKSRQGIVTDDRSRSLNIPDPELYESLQKALQELPPSALALLQLRIEGYSYDEIAKLLGTDSSVIKVRYFRTVRALKHRWDNHSREHKNAS
jgi:RNA polymerase sigma factor (sigma-70 family)